jgi:hypothetical protein
MHYMLSMHEVKALQNIFQDPRHIRRLQAVRFAQIFQGQGAWLENKSVKPLGAFFQHKSID